MNEIPRTKKLSVAQCFLKGDTYKEIEAETGVSHGSIVNIVKELESGKLNIPGCTPDHVNDLHQLSLDLKKKELSPSQALLGLVLFERCQKLEIGMAQLDLWAELVTKFTSTEFPKEDFLHAAMKLHQLEKSFGKPFEILAEEYKKAKDHLDQLTAEASSLVTKKEQLVKEIKPLLVQVDTITKEKGNLENQRKELINQVDALKSDVGEREKEKAGLTNEVKELKLKKTKLSAEVNGKEESLARLNAIGFLDEDLIRLRTILESIASHENINHNEFKKKFFITMCSFQDLTELDKSKESEKGKLMEVTKKKSSLEGEVTELEKKKAFLLGEISQASALVIEQIREAGNKAASELHLQVEDIRGSFNPLVVDVLKTAAVIGEMKAMVKKGEESEKDLKDFISEVKARVEKN